jgi:sigma-E factor negative regulatory protein RseB
LKRLLFILMILLTALACVAAWAQQVSVPIGNAQAGSSEPDVDQWLMRLHAASSQRAYVGTFVVTAGNYMSSSRIWHVCDGQQQVERVDALSGAPRSTFRRNDEVVTFLPANRVAVRETRESLGIFPDLLRQADASVAQFYRLKAVGRGRVAGLESDIVQLMPVDTMRFGYRIWTEQKSGLIMKMQTLDTMNRVLEQAAFSELQMGAPIAMAKLSALMDSTQGYQIRTPELVKTTAAQEGWVVRTSVPGFRPMSCNRRTGGDLPGSHGDTLQCVFSDGLASVSLFIESYDPARHSKLPQNERSVIGATQVLMRQLGAWWLTAVGEVPLQTLMAFAQSLERTR